jgi:hypothetical protein
MLNKRKFRRKRLEQTLINNSHRIISKKSFFIKLIERTKKTKNIYSAETEKYFM